MSPIELIVPTRNRREKLVRMLNSVPAEANGAPVEVVIVCDGDRETERFLLSLGNPAFRVVLVAEHRGAVYCRNLATSVSRGAVLYATDDIEFEKGAIDRAARELAERFPDEDGVIGFAQSGNGKYSHAGVALVGRAFVARYPGRQLFYPGYFHFACQEVLRAAETLGRFYFCEAARLVHFHPSFNAGHKDRTHVEARVRRGRDKTLSFSREAAGLTWGIGREAAR